MVLFCCVSVKIREKTPPKNLKMTDFRKADPTYLAFTPKTAEEAIDKFYRHKRLGVPVHLWPEVFVECAERLKGKELDKFESWLVNPAGPPTGVPDIKALDETNDRLRKQLLQEAVQRDLMVVDEKEEKIELGDMMGDLMIDDYISPLPEECLSYEDFAMLD